MNAEEIRKTFTEKQEPNGNLSTRDYTRLSIEHVAQLAEANEIAREALGFQKAQWAFNTDPELVAEHQLRCLIEQKKAAEKHNAGIQLASLQVGARGRS